MSKAIACVGATQVTNGFAFVSYSVSLIGPPNVSYGADYQVDTTINMAANLTAWKNKIIADAATRGVTIVLTDVIVFGAPS